MLVAEVNALQGMAAIGQRPLLMEVSDDPPVSELLPFFVLLPDVSPLDLKPLNIFFMFQEVNSILQQVVERNRVRRSLSAKRHALQSWRSLVETLLSACPADLLPADERQLIIRDLLLDLHDKVCVDL